jgi:co-chaperonin GroES (HSP10)
VKARLIKKGQAEYIPAPWNGTNESGRVPMGKNVLVMMDTCSPYTSGGLMLPENVIEQNTLAAESGIIAAIGSNAFRRHDDGTVWDGEKLEPGERVDIIKYSGVEIWGADGRLYRSMGYECIAAKLDRSVKLHAQVEEGAPE